MSNEDDLIEEPDPEWIDRTLPMDGKTGKTITPREVLMAAARMQRDGASLRRIRHEMQLHGNIPDRVLQKAIDKGHRLLAKAIARGEEPAESRVRYPNDDAAPELLLPGRDFGGIIH
jgi:lambda repressor-like predicted transcriptional regulator